jgi:hypothetical protein
MTPSETEIRHLWTDHKVLFQEYIQKVWLGKQTGGKAIEYRWSKAWLCVQLLAKFLAMEQSRSYRRRA